MPRARVALALLLLTAATPLWGADFTVREFDVPSGAHPHDVAPAPDGTVWYTGQHQGHLGRLDPATGKTTIVPLGRGSRPHGVIVGPQGHAWVTDSGLNAMVKVDGKTHALTRYDLPGGYANLNTAAFDTQGTLWFTGQSGIYGRLNPATGELAVFDAPRGRGPYGIDAAADGTVYYASLAGSYLGRIRPPDPTATVLTPPTEGQGARRVWVDSRNRAWISEWLGGKVGMYDPAGGTWREWDLPGKNPRPYSIFVDDQDIVWLSDFAANAIVRFDPAKEHFDVIPVPSRGSAIRQMLGRPGEVWGAESGTDKLIVVYTGR